MWTINDFPAYGMVSGWSTYGKLACPYCMENNKAFTLTNRGKTSFFYYHRRFLPPNIGTERTERISLLAELKRMLHPRVFLVKNCMMLYQSTVTLFGLQSGKQKFPGFGLTHNWVKRSIFWELPYWKISLLCHNLDVFENILNTVMDVKGRIKDNIKARLDIALFCNHTNMELVCDGSRVTKPRASFVLEKKAQLLVYK
jgi:hypothetical protein